MIPPTAPRRPHGPCPWTPPPPCQIAIVPVYIIITDLLSDVSLLMRLCCEPPAAAVSLTLALHSPAAFLHKNYGPPSNRAIYTLFQELPLKPQYYEHKIGQVCCGIKSRSSYYTHILERESLLFKRGRNLI